MKKRLTPIIAALCLCMAIIPVVTGCHTPTQQKLAVTTIVSTHQVVDAALDSYLDLVVTGKLATNAVPKVLTAYASYQSAYNSALTIVLGNTNAPAPPSLSNAAESFITTIGSAKKGSL